MALAGTVDLLVRRWTSLAGACALLGGVIAPACSAAEPPSPPGVTSSAPVVSASAVTPVSMAGSGAPATALTTEPVPIGRPPAISAKNAEGIVFPGGVPAEASRCAAESDAGGAIRCLLGVSLAKDSTARDLAVGLYDKLGTVTGVITEHTMDGGWRGDLHLVPEPPVGQYRRHLQWVKSGFEDIDAFFAGLDAKRPPGTRSSYRYRALALRFFRSVGRTTPSAYATEWEVSYNVSGSLHAGAAAVRETMFHEVFHLNDAAHGRWSSRALTGIVNGILSECGQKTACLTPYAPGTTMVRGGTYYAFQKGNGVWEYAAELATRYYTEHAAILRGDKLKKAPFKCGPPANQKAWTALVDEFFGVDLTPACGQK